VCVYYTHIYDSVIVIDRAYVIPMCMFVWTAIKLYERHRRRRRLPKFCNIYQLQCKRNGSRC